MKYRLFDYYDIIYKQMLGESQVLSPRRIKSSPEREEPKPPKNNLEEFFKLILPPFVVTILAFVFKVFYKICVFLWGMLKTTEQEGEASKQFHKRRFQDSIEGLMIKQDDLGFTNQVLVQQTKKTINLFLPVYITCKIKTIQDVSVRSLTGNISCALIINVHYGDLPEEIIKKLYNSIIVQLNQGQAMILADDGMMITFKRDKKARFLIFTIRKAFLAFMIEDTLWSPFQVLELVISLTLNTVTIAPNSLAQLPTNTGFQPKKEYKVSFNCMRNSDNIPISFALDCVYGVYDLAERNLETYYSRFGTYKEIKKKHQENLKQKKQDEGKQNDKLKQKEKKKIEKRSQEACAKQVVPQTLINQPMNFIKAIADNTVRRLSMRLGALDVKTPPKKVKYFQYTHLVIPLYKYPGNSLITIFLPILLLALLSLAIFFQDPNLQGRIGAIATMILGYIALIPSIKQQLPPSAKLTVIETLVYFETICCMLCLYESFIIRKIVDYQLVWYQNISFLLCLVIHSFTFLFVIGLYAIHKLKWEPGYNCDEKIVEIKPADNHAGWDNPYCDEIFSKYNQEVIAKKYGQDREENLIKIYNNPSNITTLENIHQKKENSQPKNNSMDFLMGLSKISDTPAQSIIQSTIKIDIKAKGFQESSQLLKVTSMSPRSMSEFVVADGELYDKKNK